MPYRTGAGHDVKGRPLPASDPCRQPLAFAAPCFRNTGLTRVQGHDPAHDGARSITNTECADREPGPAPPFASRLPCGSFEGSRASQGHIRGGDRSDRQSPRPASPGRCAHGAAGSRQWKAPCWCRRYRSRGHPRRPPGHHPVHAHVPPPLRHERRVMRPRFG